MISKSYFTHELFISLISKVVRRIITNPQNVDGDFLYDLSLVAPCVPRLPRVLFRRFSSLISSFARGYALMLCPRLHNHPVSTCKMNRNTIGCHSFLGHSVVILGWSTAEEIIQKRGLQPLVTTRRSQSSSVMERGFPKQGSDGKVGSFMVDRLYVTKGKGSQTTSR